MEAEYGVTSAAFGAAQGEVTAGDENLLVKFYHKAVPDQNRTKEEGRPIYKEVVYIDIRQPGNRTSAVARPVRQTDIARFPKHYERFMARQDQETYEGTPLKEWPGLTRGQVEEMKFFNVHTVEQLAAVSDSNASNFMGLQALKTKAKAYLEASKDNAAAEKLAESNKRIEELERKLEELMAAAPKKRRRRTKAELAAENIHEE